MIFTLNILIDLLLIFAIWKFRKESLKLKDQLLINDLNNGQNIITLFNNKIPKVDYSKIDGTLTKVYIKAKIAEKTADRAFNLASSANLGVIALQKSLQVPRLLTNQQVKQNNLAKTQVDKLFNSGGTMDWLRPLLTDEQLDLLDKAELLDKERQLEELEKLNGEHRS